jgi:hypothetical protein
MRKVLPTRENYARKYRRPSFKKIFPRDILLAITEPLPILIPTGNSKRYKVNIVLMNMDGIFKL